MQHVLRNNLNIISIGRPIDRVTGEEVYFGGRGDKIIGEPQVCFLQVGFDAPWRLNGHLGTILENRYWELVAGKTCEPQTKVLVHLWRGQVLSIRSKGNHLNCLKSQEISVSLA